MPSAFGHAAAAFGISRLGIDLEHQGRILVLAIILSILPDADSVGFLLGVPYDSFWGHRGFSHSILFALLISGITTVIFFNKQLPGAKIKIGFLLFLSCVSHTLLDAMTSGGLGVALFAPFDNNRYFFPFRPIKVSPINVASFFKGKGLAVIVSEAKWIGIPTLALFLLSVWFRKPKKVLSSDGIDTPKNK